MDITVGEGKSHGLIEGEGTPGGGFQIPQCRLEISGQAIGRALMDVIELRGHGDPVGGEDTVGGAEQPGRSQWLDVGHGNGRQADEPAATLENRSHQVGMLQALSEDGIGPSSIPSIKMDLAQGGQMHGEVEPVADPSGKPDRLLHQRDGGVAGAALVHHLSEVVGQLGGPSIVAEAAEGGESFLGGDSRPVDIADGVGHERQVAQTLAIPHSSPTRR